MTTSKIFQKLLHYSAEGKTRRSILNLLAWDQETYMPQGSLEARIRQLQLMSSLNHKYSVSSRWSKLLNQAIDISSGKCNIHGCSQKEERMLALWRRDYLQNEKLPASFVAKLTKTTAEASSIWALSREKNNFKKFQPILDKIFSLQKQKASYLGFNEHPYDALLDLYEPECTTKQVSHIFTNLKPFLIGLLKKKQAHYDKPSWSNYKPDPVIMSTFHKEIMKDMGINVNHCRLDYAEHPFCQEIDLTDVRITTHKAENLLSGISAVLHESGHALYELNLPKEELGSPLCDAVSLGIHESQSRLWETMIGLSLPFWKHYYPKIQSLLPEALSKVTLEQFYTHLIKVHASPIRIFADEVTYILHIILRFEIEKGLLDGTYKTKDLPDIWNGKMQEYLNITPSSDTEGCLQDIHWSHGLVGYFPTYALGNLYAAQMFEHIQSIFPDWQEKLARGDLLFITKWLNEHIHNQGRMLSPIDLVTKATHKTFSESAYINYLNAKYS